MLKRTLVLLSIFSVVMLGPLACYGFNLLQDVDTQTQWALGSAVQAGTAVALRTDAANNVRPGQYLGTALASVANYRFLNLAAGGTFIPQADGSLRALDTVKLGLNLAYVFKNFVNQPPAIISNLVIGPALATSVVSTPHVVIPMAEINYSFGK